MDFLTEFLIALGFIAPCNCRFSEQNLTLHKTSTIILVTVGKSCFTKVNAFVYVYDDSFKEFTVLLKTSRKVISKQVIRGPKEIRITGQALLKKNDTLMIEITTDSGETIPVSITFHDD